jgi:hypothetical protein
MAEVVGSLRSGPPNTRPWRRAERPGCSPPAPAEVVGSLRSGPHQYRAFGACEPISPEGAVPLDRIEPPLAYALQLRGAVVTKLDAGPGDEILDCA